MSWRVHLDIDKGGARGMLTVKGFASSQLAYRIGSAFLLALVGEFPGPGSIRQRVEEDGHAPGSVPVPPV